jgi:DNA-binding HxlR family transcriptional regulator
MRRKSLNTATCPVARSLDVIGDWWTLLIVREAFKGASRFSEFQQGLGLAKNILSSRLRKMLADGILELRPAAAGGSHLEYHLTHKGIQLRLILIALRQWGEDNLFVSGEPMTTFVDSQTGQSLKRLRPIRQDGTEVGFRDLVTKLVVAGEGVD